MTVLRFVLTRLMQGGCSMRHGRVWPLRSKASGISNQVSGLGKA
jgi:hypothetical protein